MNFRVVRIVVVTPMGSPTAYVLTAIQCAACGFIYLGANHMKKPHQ